MCVYWRVWELFYKCFSFTSSAAEREWRGRRASVCVCVYVCVCRCVYGPSVFLLFRKHHVFCSECMEKCVSTCRFICVSADDVFVRVCAHSLSLKKLNRFLVLCSVPRGKSVCFLFLISTSVSSAVASVWRGRRAPTFSSAAVKATCATRSSCTHLKRPRRPTRTIQPPTVCTVQHAHTHTHSYIPMKITNSQCLNQVCIAATPRGDCLWAELKSQLSYIICVFRFTPLCYRWTRSCAQKHSQTVNIFSQMFLRFDI